MFTKKLLLMSIAMLMSWVCSAQSGGMKVRSISAAENITVGNQTESVVILNDLVALPPLTNIEIQNLGNVSEGSLVYASDSDVLVVFDGDKWKRIDGLNDEYLTPPPPPCELTYYDQEAVEFQGVLIGTQCWMSRNVNIGSFIQSTIEQTDNGTLERYCYQNNENYCDTYGGLYQWNEAMGYSSTDGSQGICPDGWHIPTDAEWKVLEGTVDSSVPVGDPIWDGINLRGTDCGTHLKSETLWNISGNGDNTSGFNAVPASFRYDYSSNFGNLGYYTYLWTSTENAENVADAWFRRLQNNNTNSGRWASDKGFARSIRCLRD